MTTRPVFLAAHATIVAGDRVVLDGPEGRHAAKVRRMTVGEELDLVDGSGLRARCEVVSVAAEQLVLRVTAHEQERVPSPRVVVVQALAKGDRGERAIEVLTEVGVDEVVPWSAARSVVEWRGDRGARSLERWRSTARESAKQSRRARFTEVTDVATTADVQARLRAAAGAYVLHEDAEHPLGALPVPTTGEVVLVVGPEGGITADELAGFAAAGAAAVRLGPTVLRTSTAGVVAASLVLAQTRW